MRDTIKNTNGGLALVLLLLIASRLCHNDFLVSAATAVLVLCMAAPRLFAPFARLWLRLSQCLGAVTVPLLLALLFTLLVVPVGLARRLLGKDVLKLSAWRSGSGSHFTERLHRHGAADLEHPY